MGKKPESGCDMKNNKGEKQVKRKFSWFKLFSNNRFVAVFSLLAAFSIWMIMMNGNTDEMQSWKVDNVPIVVEYTTGAVEAGYKVYDTDRSAVTVSVSGNSLSVRQVQASDIEVVATINDSVKPGSNTVTLTARKKSDALTNFTIEGIEPSTITAEIDVAKETVFEIENGIQATPAEDYYISTPQFSVETVSVSGPESVVAQIKNVRAEYVFSEPLSESKSFSAALVAYNESGEVIENEFLTFSVETVEVRLPVLWKQNVSLKATFTNRPSAFPSSLMKISPSSITIAGAKESFSTIKDISLNPLDFGKVNLSTTKFSMDIVVPEGFTNISNTQTATISFDLSDYLERWITIDEIAQVNVPSNVTVIIPDESLSVLVVGPSTDISQLTDQNIYARVDLSGQQFMESGEVQLTITVSVQDSNSCWVYGTYTVAAEIVVDS